MGGGAVAAASNTFNIKPPLLGELNAFDLGGELDSSSEFLNFEESFRRRRNQINIMDDVRSSGEIGAEIGLGLTESIGEIKPGNLYGKVEETKKKSRYDVKGKKDPLGQTIDYEGGLSGTASHNNSKIHLRTSEDDLGPIYDSKEDPIPKYNKKGNGMKSNVLMSGESFGKNPLNRSSGGFEEKIRNAKKGMPEREQIAEDFLEEDEMLESGELNPHLFR